MFQTTKCSSLGRPVHAVLKYVFMRPYKQSGPIKLHVQVFLRMNTWLFETCRSQYN